MKQKYRFSETIEVPYNEIRIKESTTGSTKTYNVGFYNKGTWIATMEPIPVDFSKEQSLIIAEISGVLQIRMGK